MATFLLTIRDCVHDKQGLRLSPGIRPSEWKERPAIAKMMQGSPLQLRLPDGTTRTTRLETYGVSVYKGEDGSLLMYDDPKDPEIKLTLPPSLNPEDVPAGTEVWLLDVSTF